MIDMNEIMKKAQELSENMKQPTGGISKTDFYSFSWWRNG